ncbi:Acb2/Tad1 domain-containing protein [Gilliamella apicola]|uniref:Acb2/Tad1 domain-containing protein n=1 Tax=Gilliamella apicola TaxID=1196095 RepID=UPI000A35A419|nr:hypothetical protein [Gilliamella apicola]OTP93772.1 hypothetical protein B6D13_09185 [Gilliamella apicola]OTQ00739.1 hypothetical protein B6D07_09885 [Gilliamella apicola]OTQ30418.1 hypothetical protein B6D02_05395 [Gilliamella apicola]
MKSLTYGQKLVNTNFNPAELESVGICKKYISAVIDQLNDLREKTESPETKRSCSIAITELQGAQMWAVNALTSQLSTNS